MKRITDIVLLLTGGVAMHSGCDSKKILSAAAREAVKEVVTQPLIRSRLLRTLSKRAKTIAKPPSKRSIKLVSNQSKLLSFDNFTATRFTFPLQCLPLCADFMLSKSQHAFAVGETSSRPD